MSKDKKSFFERLAGSVMVEDNDRDEEVQIEVDKKSSTCSNSTVSYHRSTAG